METPCPKVFCRLSADSWLTWSQTPDPARALSSLYCVMTHMAEDSWFSMCPILSPLSPDSPGFRLLIHRMACRLSTKSWLSWSSMRPVLSYWILTHLDADSWSSMCPVLSPTVTYSFSSTCSESWAGSPRFSSSIMTLKEVLLPSEKCSQRKIVYFHFY